MKTIYLNGRYLNVSEQMLEVLSPGAFSPKGVFETMLGKNGFVMDVNLHLIRLRQGLEILGIKAPYINPMIPKEVLRRNQLNMARIRIMVWHATSLKAGVTEEIHVMVVALPYKVPAKRNYRVCLIETNRQADSRMSNVKSLDYVLFAQAHAKAVSQGFDEALLLNRKGYIFEASRANIFWIKDKVLYTPPLSSGCLNGITRQQVMAQAKGMKIDVEEKNLTPEILKQADAGFITNSLLGIKAIDNKSFSVRSI